MKLVSEKLPHLDALYVQRLRSLLSAEEQIVRYLPHMAELATDAELKQTYRSHIQETEHHAARLRAILERTGGKTDPVKCKGVEALIAESESMVEDADHEAIRDASMIAAAQTLEHYEIAAYGTVRHFARVLGREEDEAVLDQTLQEEERADHRLSTIAERVNPAAVKVA